MFLVIGGLSMMSHHYTLGNIKSRTVGDGQHGTAKVRMVSRRSFRNRPKSSDGSMSAISPEPACG